MANIKFTEFPSATVVGSMDIIPIVQDGANKKTTAAVFATYMGTLFATLTGTQTLTNKTLTSPKINQILDSNGNEILAFTPIASAVDYISIKNGIGVGVPLHISATGDSANIGLHIETKGTGLVQISDGTDTTKGIRFRSSGSAAAAVTLIDAVSSAGRVITLPNATGTLALTSQLTSGTVTSVAALTLGTSGTDLTSSVATGTTTPVITLNVPTASAANRGALSSADWTTFNNKQNALTNPITGTGTTNYLPKFTGASALGDSLVYDSGTAIGIGTISPSDILHIEKNGTTTYTSLKVTNTNSTAVFYVGVGGNSVLNGGLQNNAYLFNDGNSAIVFGTNAAERMRITAAGNVQLQQGLSLNAATAPASGIEFPSTQVASASANNLDDYEEGTWTMGVAFGGASVGVTYTVNTGSYVKIGKQVTVNGYVVLSSKGISTGLVTITGLPFTIGSTTGNYSSATLRLSNITFTNQFQGWGNINTTNILLEQITVLGVVSDLTDTNFSNSSGILLSLTYFV